MIKVRVVKFVFIAFLLLFPFLQGAERPNIVFIIADDLTYSDIGCYGGVNVATPHIDSIASDGMKITRCFQASAMCSPTRHNIYTGLYPIKSGAYPNSTLAKEGTKSVVHFLGDLGYRVALTGKRHIQPESVFPFEYLNEKGDPDLQALERFWSQESGQPSCAFICFNEPHTPWTKGDASEFDPDKLVLPPYFVDTDETRRQLVNYYAEVQDLDQSVGKVIALLDRLEMREKTLLIFVSEQGIAMPFAKWTCYESGLQSAFLARWPGKIAPGSVSNAMIEYVDILPTFIEVAGGASIEVLEGESFMPVLLGQREHHKDYAFALQTTRGISNGSEHYGVRSIRSHRYKYLINLTPETRFQNNLTEDKGGWTAFWKTWVDAAKTDPFAEETVHRYQWRPAEELYDLESDRYEFNNLAGQKDLKEVQHDLRRRLLEWMDQQGDLGQETEMAALSRTFKPGGTAGK